MIRVETQYVSKWLWGAGEGACWFLNYTSSSGLRQKKKKQNRTIDSQPGQSKFLPGGIVV